MGISKERSAMDIMFYSMAHVFKYIEGATTLRAGALRGYHYDKPCSWETDAFEVIDVEPEIVVKTVRDYRPGPHLISVFTQVPQSIVASYEALGYKTVRNEPIETVMEKNLKDFGTVPVLYTVELVRTEAQRQFYNSAIEILDVDDPLHGQMQPEEIGDPALRYYYIKMDDKCVCIGKAILPFQEGLTVEPLGTHKNYRRRGIAIALMNQLHMDAAISGVEKSVIPATEMGAKLYSKLGYKVIGYIQKFVPKDWPKGIRKHSL